MGDIVAGDGGAGNGNGGAGAGGGVVDGATTLLFLILTLGDVDDNDAVDGATTLLFLILTLGDADDNVFLGFVLDLNATFCVDADNFPL